MAGAWRGALNETLTITPLLPDLRAVGERGLFMLARVRSRVYAAKRRTSPPDGSASGVGM